MDAVDHGLWVGVAGGIKLMTAPLVFLPVEPVLYDIVNWDMSAAELCQRLFYLAGGLIALTTLPESQCPLGIERGTTGQCTITRNHLIHILAGNEIVVHVLCHLTPY